jgi:hypothetical protein
METLSEAYQMAKKNNGAPGMDGVTFEAIAEGGVETPGDDLFLGLYPVLPRNRTSACVRLGFDRH